ncbi:MAG: heparinase II/III family protein [Planctomycetota bacterium]|nr:heparinase II/III family protein [Planctomycetota bacterium]MDP7129717.1 heparinase II/III family protein [Planctomycetota bacterium]
MPFRTGEHPRLLFSAAELPDLRAGAKSGLKARVLERAKQLCANYMDPEHPDFLDFREREKDIWRLRYGIFTVLPVLDTLSACYAFTGDPEVGDFARDAVMEIIDHGLADVKSSAWGSKDDGWRHGLGHDKGMFAHTMACVYDICHDRFSNEQRARFAEYAKESVGIVLEYWREDWYQITNNRGVRGIMPSAMWCMAVEGEIEIEDFERYIDQSESAIEQYLFNSIDTTGAPFEGPQYVFRSCVPYCAAAAEAIRRRGGTNLLKNNRFERLLEYLLYELIPGGGTLNNLNDCQPSCGSIACSLTQMGKPGGKLLPWLGAQLDFHPERRPDWLDENDDLSETPQGTNFLYFLLWWRDDIPCRTPQELGYPLARHFTGRGVVSMRTGWEKDDWLVSHFCGPQVLKCHRQGDSNHVAFYALGERFLVDAGYGIPQADSTKGLDRWFGETDAHNCVLVDGRNQRGPHITPGWTEGEMVDFSHTDDFTTSLGDAASTTGPDHRIRRSFRRVVLVRKGPVPFLVVVDLNEYDGEPFSAECLWHTESGNDVELSAGGFVIHGQQNDCFARVLYPQTADIQLADSYTRPQVRVSLRAAVAESVTVFCPVRRGEEVPEFICDREAEGHFSITCRSGGSEITARMAAAVTEPLRQPIDVEVV